MRKKTIRRINYRVRKNISTYQKQFLLQNMGCSRKVTNLYVNFLYEFLEANNYTGGERLPKIKLLEVTFFKKDYDFLNDADSLALANAKMNFESAISKYNNECDHTSYTKRALRKNESGKEPLSFRGLKGMPKFKAKAKGDFSYTTNNNAAKTAIRLKGNMLHVPKIKEDIPLVIHRQLPRNAVIKNATISMDTDGTFEASLCYEIYTDIDDTIINAAYNNDASVLNKLSFLGLDYSQTSFYVDSDGKTANYPHFYKNAEERLAFEQRKLSRMELGSENYKRQKLKVAKLHKKIRNQRNDFTSKEAHKLSSLYDVIVVEDINLRNLAQCLSLGKNLHDNGFGMFRNKLLYKLVEKGSVLVKTDRWFPSSKTCSECGHLYDELELGESTWVCPNCGVVHNRDENAAINIREEGKLIFADYLITYLGEQTQKEAKLKAKKETKIKKRHKVA